MYIRGKAVFCACKEGVKCFLSPSSLLFIFLLSSSPSFPIVFHPPLSKPQGKLLMQICIICKTSFTDIVNQCL